ncbi:MAG: MarR family winged helix-turn-helix transcriptional regulator [Actinomycetota bacterium]|nr:MarR family winged helix-turn-helix transcriptional regulator [Actinomycetota bacterium]
MFRLNGQLLAIAEELAQPAGLTAAWWQVLATVLREPLSVADIAREVGNTRQSVQRIADLLVEHDLAGYRPNPAHRRAKLLVPTEQGRAAVRRIRPAHAALADRLVEQMGLENLQRTLDALVRLSSVLDEMAPITE